MADFISASDIQNDVDAFNATYGEMDRALWCLAKYARLDLLRGQDTAVIAALVRTIKEWWGIQGARNDIDVIASRALIRQPWTEDLLTDQFEPSGERFAVERVEGLVEAMYASGAERRELSLASKTLHWLMPWRVPAYDSYVRKVIGVGESRTAYGEVVRHVFRTARRHAGADSRWMGEIDPRAAIRACDKCFWWRGGGNRLNARMEPDPWKVIRALGLNPS